MGEKRQVSIDQDAYEQLRARLQGTSFGSVDEYVAYLIRIHLGKKPTTSQDEDNAKVEEHLKSLGYI